MIAHLQLQVVVGAVELMIFLVAICTGAAIAVAALIVVE
jgi:hypothetical protein